LMTAHIYRIGSGIEVLDPMIFDVSHVIFFAINIAIFAYVFLHKKILFAPIFSELWKEKSYGLRRFIF
jgi:hypothetical protein